MEVAERILDDERHHVPFQCRRLRAAFEQTSVPAQVAIEFVWRAVAFAVIVVVAIDHGRALAVCGMRCAAAGVHRRHNATVQQCCGDRLRVDRCDERTKLIARISLGTPWLLLLDRPKVRRSCGGVNMF